MRAWQATAVFLLLLWARDHEADASSVGDTDKGLFSAAGRLVQLDYVEVRKAIPT